MIVFDQEEEVKLKFKTKPVIPEDNWKLTVIQFMPALLFPKIRFLPWIRIIQIRVVLL